MNFPNKHTACWPTYPQTQPELLCPCLTACMQRPRRLWCCFPAHLLHQEIAVVPEDWGKAMGRRLFMGLWPNVHSLNSMPDIQHHALFSQWGSFSNMTRSSIPHLSWPCTFSTFSIHWQGRVMLREDAARITECFSFRRTYHKGKTPSTLVLGEGCMLHYSWSNQGWPWPQAQWTHVLQGQGCIWSHIPKPSHSSQSLATAACSFPPVPSLETLESSFFLCSPSKFDSLPCY